ncbi:hypothetical protein CAPTEDRAFT_17805 [Capitella teleta]|uniref:Uncharacterized protein n=1 Tax=Capitella teleta TaxID=283909 RepID=R7UIH4_CAPTE|nr:hypothetical protein CAPTEDRAFT_17805 [Capitella teleta]|eukprot:ELU03588.1 hypothetical protein CAPTEDRAFT_17805 [Capitella teleta]
MRSDVDQSLKLENHYQLQIAFSQGLLKPGLNVEVFQKAKPINNKPALTSVLEEISKADLPWIERLDLASKPVPAPKPMLEQLGENPDVLSSEDVNDDFKREMLFYRQAQAAVLEALPRLKSMGVATLRPTDYFAQMAKSDDHMKKVKRKLLSKQAAMERSEKMKKMRELKKFGKKVQHEVTLKRHKEKRDMMEAVKKFRKGKTDKLDILDDDNKKHKSKNPGRKRQVKNQKFGFGGQKKRSKYNTAESSADTGGLKGAGKKGSGKKGSAQKGPARKFQGGNKNKRPGKRRRDNVKGKNNKGK